MRSLITGVGGFVGQHLASLLLGAGEAVVGVARGDVRWHVPIVPAHSGFTLLQADLLDAGKTTQAVKSAAPDRVYHLAAISSVDESFRDPIGTIRDNLALQVNVLDAVRALAPAARILIVSSAEIYGRAIAGAIDEEAPLRPENPYAVSKASQDLLAYQYSVCFDLDIVRVRPFNHIGPGQSDRFVAASFGRQIAEIEAGLREPVLRVGNLSTTRDFTDGRDIVRAYQLALLSGGRGDAYNLGTGRGVSIHALLDRFVACSSAHISVEVDEARLRRADAPVMLCNSQRFRDRTGWEPLIPLDTTIADILSYWRERIHAA